MSSSFPTYSPSEVISMNVQLGEELGWRHSLPSEFLAEYPDLRFLHPDFSTSPWQSIIATQKAAKAAAVLQQVQKDWDLPLEVQDGVLDWYTYHQVLRRYDAVPNTENYVVLNQRRSKISVPDDFPIHVFDQGGLDLHPAKKFGAYSIRKPTRIVWHWGGSNAESLFSYFLSTSRQVSSHGAVDETGLYQWLDFGHRAWHAGYANTDAIGFDISQQPTTKHLDQYLRAGRDVHVVDNASGRGDEKILTLDPRIARFVRIATLELCRVFDIPLETLRNPDGTVKMIGAENEDDHTHGVFGHHHFDHRKWDVACWWNQCFEGTPLA